MDGIQLDLEYLLLHQSLIDEDIKLKLILTIKYYLSKASTNVRNPKVIQLNHYIDAIYASNNGGSHSIVYSPSKVPLPVSGYINYELIRNNSSKLFMVNNEGDSEIHCFEYIIPTMIAVFSGPSFNKKLELNGSLFVSSLLICIEVSDHLLDLKLPSLQHSCLTIILVASSLLAINKGDIAYMIEMVLSTNEAMNIRDCLELLVMSTFPPHWSSNNKLSDKVTVILERFEKPFIDKQLTNSFSGMKNLLFCLPSLSPLTSIICSSFSMDICQSAFTKIIVSVNSQLSKNLATFSGEKALSRDDAEFNVKRCLASYVVWCRSDCKDNFNWILFDTDNLQIKDVFEKLVLQSVENGNFQIKLNITYSNNSSEKCILLNKNEVISSINNLNSLIKKNILYDLQCTVGVDATRILFQNLDSISNQGSMEEVLSLVYQRPALD